MHISAKIALVLGVSAVAACTQPAPPPIQVEAPPPPSVKVFTASPTEVAAGEKTTLAWEVENAKSVSIELLGSGPVPGVSSTQLSGQVEVTIEKDALFLLTAHGEGGIDQQSAGVFTVGTSRSVLLTAVPGRIVAGQSATLVWSAAGATTVALADGDGNAVDIGSPAPSTGVVEVTPASTTRYVLSADSRTISTEIQVDAVIHDFRLSEGPYLPGEQVTLHWRTGAGTALSLSAAGRGEIYAPSTAGEITEGSYTDTIPADLPLNSRLDYTLRLEQGSKVFEVVRTINIGVNPTIEVTHPTYASKVGAEIDIGWSANGADAIDVYFNGTHSFRTTDPDLANVGSVEGYTPPAGLDEVTVRVVATNAKGGEAEKTVVVDLVGAPVIDPTNGFTASPQSGVGGEPITLSWNVPEARNAVVTDESGKAVVSVSGLEAESSSAQVYPNKDSVYTLTVDNTLGESDTADLTVTIAPTGFNTRGDNGVFVQGSEAQLYLDSLPAPAATHVYKMAETFVRFDTSLFQDIRMSGGIEVVPNDTDDGVGVISPDFAMDLLGTDVDGLAGITISTNGWLAFGVYSDSDRSGSIPSSFNNSFTVAPLWDDLEMHSTGAIHYQVTGAAPNRKLVVQWSNMQEYNDSSTILSFQAQLSEDGTIALAYQLHSGTGGNFNFFQAGVQGVDSSVYAEAENSFGPNGIADGMSYYLGLLEYPLPLTVTLDSAGPFEYLVKRGDTYMPVAYTVPTLVKTNDLTVAEVMFAPASPYETTGEWIELRNRTTRDIDLADFTLTLSPTDVITITSTTPGDTVIPAGGTYLLAQSGDTMENGEIAPDYVYGSAVAIPDGAGSFSLAKGGEVSSFSFNTSFGGQGGPAISVVNDYAPYLVASGSSVSARVCEPATSTTYGTAVVQRGSPGTTTTCSPYLLQAIQPSFTDITEAPYAATALFTGSFSDNAVASLDLGVPFPYFGVTPATNSSVRVGFNGYVTLDMVKTISSTYTPTLYPSTSDVNSLISVFGDDLYWKAGEPNSTVFALRMPQDADLNNPAPHWVIQWNRVSSDSAAPANEDTLTFQVKLFDSGRIEYHYDEMSGTHSSRYHEGSSANAWLEADDGSYALMHHGYSRYNVGIAPNTAVAFIPAN